MHHSASTWKKELVSAILWPHQRDGPAPDKFLPPNHQSDLFRWVKIGGDEKQSAAQCLIGLVQMHWKTRWCGIQCYLSLTASIPTWPGFGQLRRLKVANWLHQRSRFILVLQYGDAILYTEKQVSPYTGQLNRLHPTDCIATLRWRYAIRFVRA